MRTYYFDTKDGVPIRDNMGITFARASQAIEHSKTLAAGIRGEARKRDHNLTIVVTDESGTEIHREPVYASDADGC